VQQPALSRATVDRNSDSRADAQWLRDAWRNGARVLLLDADLRAAVSGEDEQPALVWTSPQTGEPPADAVLLGADDAGSYWALDRPAPAAEAGHAPLRMAGLRDVGQHLSAHDSGLLTHAVAVITWHRTHTHCPRCGSPTEPSMAGAVRVCTNDRSEHFPRVDPAMIVLVQSPDGQSAVLGRGAQWPHPFFSCLAGFVEPGESAEQAVVREVAEEVGLAVRDVRYQASQPWPFPSSLMLGFTAVADVGPLHPNPTELAAAAWFTRDEVNAGLETRELGVPPPVSIARGLIDDWLAGSGR
jgi:NAD+ diphosphatase